jgi:hypothetical protein
MAAAKFLENYYSFRKTDLVYGTFFHPRTPDQAALAEIESELSQAHTQFLSRQFTDAIATYLDTKSLIYAQIDPGYTGNAGNGSLLSVDPKLFVPLLSASLEWLNILPVQQAVPAVRPRVPVDPAMLGAGAQLDQTGLASTQASSPASINTIADWQMAETFQAKGYTQTAQFFSRRAAAADPKLFGTLSQKTSPAGAVPAAPVPAPEAPIARLAGEVAVAAAANGGATQIATSRAGAGLPPGLSFSEMSGTGQLVPLPASVSESRTLGVMVNGQVQRFNWNLGEAPTLTQVQANVYQARIALKFLPDVLLNPQQPSDIAISLPHDYYYVVPLGLAECYHALGDYVTAETYYFQAAAYQYLNNAIEAPYIWQRLATLYLDWGNSLFSQDDAANALTLYEHVVMPDMSVPNSTLYTTPALAPGAAQGKIALANLNNLTNLLSLGLNPVLCSVVVEVWQQIVKIQGGLDYWGFYRSTVPIWTFDYLQSVAVNFTQLAISAERDVINFWDRADQAKLTQQQLSENLQQTNAEAQAAGLQVGAAIAEGLAYLDGQTLANQRATDAQNNLTTYQNTANLTASYSAEAAQINGGDYGDPQYLNQLADTIVSGQGISGSTPTVAAAFQLAGSKYTQQYEVNSLQNTVTEMQAAATQATAEWHAANARTDAAKANLAVANLRAQAAQQDLSVFDSQTFTPDVWYRMGDTMMRLYQRYLAMALRAAKLMQAAYNFETDQSLQVIKGDYSTNTVKGLLGADMLMADVQSFTYDLITSSAGKPQSIKQTISLAEQYAYLFETQFRKTGSMKFETRIQDFDFYYPGTFAGRIDAVEVEVDGIVPVTGISGTFTNSGISSYRLPSTVPLKPGDVGLKFRVQPKETLILSDYAARQDALLSKPDDRIMTIFQGAGVASSWEFDLPKAINDIDYGALTDVRITFYYKARFDPTLQTTVLNQLQNLPGINARQRSIPLRWVYPDAFFRFQDSGQLAVTLNPRDFRSNETKPVLTSIAILVATDGSVPAANLKVSLGTPTQAAVTGQTDANGIISSATGPWIPLGSGTAIGNYTVGMTAADNQQLVKAGKFSLAPIVNIALIFQYTYTPKA